MRRALSKLALVAPLALVACGGKPSAQTAQHPTFSGPVQPRRSTANERESVAITIYNGNFGLVREVRTLDLPPGKVGLEFADVAAALQPNTVHIKSLAGESALTIFEQNYRYDLLTPQKLLEKYVGKKVKVYRWNETLGRDEEFEAEVLSVEEGATLKIGNEVTYGFPGRISFPEIPANLIAKPTLVWLLGSTVPKQKIEVTYVTNSMNWSSDYVLSIDASDKVGDLTGWVTLRNSSGAAYENATLKLVAGDVQKFASPDAVSEADEEITFAKSAKEKSMNEFSEEGFFEYHLYTLGRPTTLMQNEQKQVTLLQSSGFAIDKKLIFFGGSYYYRSSYGQVASNQKVGVFLDIDNSEKNKLGMPLPKGTIRVYKSDKTGAQQFIGEDRIDHTPRDEKIRIKMGEAFDVVGDRKQMSWKPMGKCTSESEWEIALRNHKDVAETVEVIEPVGGDWEILSSSHPSKKVDAHTFTFEPKVPAKGDVKIKYRVRVRWC